MGGMTVNKDGNGGWNVNLQTWALKRYGLAGLLVLSLLGGGGFKGVGWALEQYHQGRALQEQVADNSVLIQQNSEIINGLHEQLAAIRQQQAVMVEILKRLEEQR